MHNSTKYALHNTVALYIRTAYIKDNVALFHKTMQIT